jgi:hypothetical protein
MLAERREMLRQTEKASLIHKPVPWYPSGKVNHKPSQGDRLMRVSSWLCLWQSSNPLSMAPKSAREGNPPAGRSRSGGTAVHMLSQKG